MPRKSSPPEAGAGSAGAGATVSTGAGAAAGAKSKYSLYNQEFVTFEEDDVYNQADGTGFVNLFGLPLKVRALMQEKTGLLK